MDTSYLLDPSDRVVAVDAAWIAFAEANDAAALPDRVIGRSLWTFIVNPTVQELYRTLFRRVRATDQGVTVPFRCDSPAVQRFMTLAVDLDDGPRGTLACHVSLLKEEPQPQAARALYSAMRKAGASELRGAIAHSGDPMSVLEGAHAGAPLSMCSWCKRLEVDGWCEIDEALARHKSLFTEPVRPITHGICPACEEAVLAEIS